MKNRINKTQQKSYNCYSLSFVLIFAIKLQGALSEEVIITPKTVEVLEDSSVVLTCTTTGHFSAWKVGLSGAFPSLYVDSDGTCQATGILNNTKLYDWSCHRNGSFSLTLLKVSRSQHGEKLRCSSNLIQFSNEVTINVKIPVEAVEITNPAKNTTTLLENVYKLFSCNTSYSRPTPIISWFIRLARKSMQINKTSSDVILSDGKDFESMYSVLNISFNRTQQDAEVYCTGENGIGAETVSRNITLNIKYAPERGPYIDKASTNSYYTVKENSTFNVTCTIPWGNPRPKLSWNCNGTQTSSFKEQNEARLNLQWVAKRDEDKVCTCTSQQSIAGVQTAIIMTIVLYPPSIDSIIFEHTSLNQRINVNTIIHVIENETYTLICEASSKPEPTYKWTGLAHSNNSTVVILNQHRRENYTETCHATNVMMYSDGDNETTEVNKSVKVNVLFPPKIDVMHDRRVIEGSDTNMTCPILLGNPSATNITWTRDFDDRYWLEQSFTIPNISRSDSTRYTCKAKNTMVMTGNIKRIGSAMEFINLEVLYPPNRPKLVLVVISEHDVNITLSDKLTVAENTPFTLVCEADSQPKPNLYSWNQMSLSNSANFQSPGITRHDKNEVNCTVRNTMIASDETKTIGENDKTISLDVLYSPDIEDLKVISSEEGTNVNVSCPVIYGNPKETTITWIRHEDGQQWIGANFTLEKVSRTDSAEYTCRVNNTMIMTGGFRKEGQNSKSIKLNVLYRVSILNYTADNYSYNNNVTVDENETVNLRCKLEGNPAPEGSIYSKKDIVIKQSLDETFAVYSASFKATCYHKGIYSCRGINYIKEKEKVSERNITLYVTCKPRPDPTFPWKSRIKVNEDEAMVINLTMLAYPEPDTVNLYKFNGETLTSINDDNIFEVVIRGLDIHITIRRVPPDDYGKYNLTISNEFGTYDHVFYIEATVDKLKTETDSANYGLNIGLPLAIIIIIACIVVGTILYRKRYCPIVEKLFQKKKRRTETDTSNVYQNITGAQNNESGNEHNKIRMNQTKESKTDYEKYSPEIRINNEGSVTYEKLSERQTDKSLYSDLNATNKKTDITETNENIPDNKEPAIYVNMKI